MAPTKGKKPAAAVDIPECPVCLEPMTAPIFLCQSGHSLCSPCTVVLCPSICPVCRQPMTQMRNRSLEEIIDKAKVPCPNRSSGCVYTLAGAAVADHLKECIFRTMDCPLGAVFGKCSWTGEVKQMVEHIKDKHPREFVGNADVELDGVTLRECDRRVFLATQYKLIFIITVKIDTLQHLAYWTVQLIGPKKQAQQHIYEIHVTSKQDLQRKVTFIEHCSNDTVKADDIFKQSKCAVIPLNMLAHFIKDNKLTFRYCIRKIGCENQKPNETGEVAQDYRPQGPRSASTSRGVGEGAKVKGPGQKGHWHKGQKGPGPRNNVM